MCRDVMQADAVEDFGGVVVHVWGGWVVEAEGAEVAGDGDFVGGQVGVHFNGAGGLNESQAFAELVEVDVAEGLAEHLDASGGGPEMAGDDAGEGAFGAAVGAEDRGAGAAFDSP